MKMEVISKDPILEFLPDTLAAIRKLYNLDNGRMEQSVDILEQWMKKQQHFRNKNFNREYLERTVIACKGSVEKAKSQIDKLCTLKTLLPKFFVLNNVKERFSNVNEIACVVPMPKMTKEYQRVIIIQMSDKEFTSAHYLDYYKLNLMIAEYLKAHDYVNGFVIVEDYRNVNLMELITKMNFIEFQQFVTIMTDGFGAKLKGIHIITKSKVIDMFVKLIRNILPEKLVNRLHVHSELEELHHVVDKNLLPIDLGGNEKSIMEFQDAWMDVLGSNDIEKYLEEMRASNTDESLRETDKFNERYMGIAGSFRTLTVD